MAIGLDLYSQLCFLLSHWQIWRVTGELLHTESQYQEDSHGSGTSVEVLIERVTQRNLLVSDAERERVSSVQILDDGHLQDLLRKVQKRLPHNISTHGHLYTCILYIHVHIHVGTYIHVCTYVHVYTQFFKGGQKIMRMYINIICT